MSFLLFPPLIAPLLRAHGVDLMRKEPLGGPEGETAQEALGSPRGQGRVLGHCFPGGFADLGAVGTCWLLGGARRKAGASSAEEQLWHSQGLGRGHVDAWRVGRVVEAPSSLPPRAWEGALQSMP